MPSLDGSCVLVVEDEPLVALDIQDCLQAEGAQVFCANSLAQALELANGADIDAAVIDYGLGGERGDPLCDDLNRRGVPFLIYTGYCTSDLHGHWNRTPILSKPAPCECIVSAVLALLHSPAVQSGDFLGSFERG